MKKSNIIAIIPARGGSKEIPRKNLKLLHGKELIYYTINAAIKSGICNKVVVDTDDEEIAEIANKYGAATPYLRPIELADDKAPIIDVVLNCIKWHQDNNEFFNNFIMLQPTSPFRSYESIVNAYKKYDELKAEVLVSVNEAKCIPQRMFELPHDMSLSDFSTKNNANKNRQDLVKYYEFNGAIIIGNTESLISTKTWFPKKTYAFKIDFPENIDIDTKNDLLYAKFLMENSNELL